MAETTMRVADEGFASMGRGYQEKVATALLSDHQFADQMMEVLDPKFFEVRYLSELARILFDYHKRYKTFPSWELVETIFVRDEDVDELAKSQGVEFLRRAKDAPLNGDARYIQDTSLDFCRRQALKEAMLKAVDMVEESDYDSVQKVIKEALCRGAVRELGHDYMEGFAARSERSVRKPLPTGWPVLDKQFNGGLDRGTLMTFIAPTGAGKSMFLVNVGAGALMNGLNVLYCTLEMADYKIGLRFDSYFSGVAINDVPNKGEEVQGKAREQVKGRLFIKEYPTKKATVQTIRSYLQRLETVKGFRPDILLVDYADLLRGAGNYGDKRFELEGIYEELRGLAQEFNIAVVTADQTNRAGLDMEVVTIGQIGESYAKATVCDVIVTISRRMEDKMAHRGRIFVAKSRLGADGVVFPFLMNSATVKVTILNQADDPSLMFLDGGKKDMQTVLSERFEKLNSGNRAAAAAKKD